MHMLQGGVDASVWAQSKVIRNTELILGSWEHKTVYTENMWDSCKELIHTAWSLLDDYWTFIHIQDQVRVPDESQTEGDKGVPDLECQILATFMFRYLHQSARQNAVRNRFTKLFALEEVADYDSQTLEA